MGIAATATALAQNPMGTGLEAAKDQLRHLQVANGLSVQLFASEPMVVNPTNLDIDAKGRVWVTEGANYRMWQPWGKLRPEGDRILILEDTDLDGSADKSTVFHQGNDVNAALGICVLGNKVMVACSPNLLIFEDTDGDDKADKKEVLFTGIGGIDHDHGLHAPVFGPDGKLYFNFGSSGSKINHANGSLVTDPLGHTINGNGSHYREGMIFRCHLDGSQIEVIGYNFRNPFEVAVDSFGGLWQSDNDDEGYQAARLNNIMEYGNYGYRDELSGQAWQDEQTNMDEAIQNRHWHHKDPGTIPSLLHTGAGTPKGIVIYEGSLLPNVFHHQIIQCDAERRTVRAYITKIAGAGYEASIQNILSSNDTWFHPSDVGVAPDGSLIVADWNDAKFDENQMADQHLESLSGRIYRVAPVETSAYVIQPAPFDSAKDAVMALRSPNLSTRYLAWTQLSAMQSKALPELLALWQNDQPHLRARALHLLARIKGRSKVFLQEAISDDNAKIRATALRIARSENENVIEMVKSLFNDASPLVRRECAIALRHSKSEEAPSLWALLAMRYDRNDRW